jgi:hypothetical protein
MKYSLSFNNVIINGAEPPKIDILMLYPVESAVHFILRGNIFNEKSIIDEAIKGK